MLNPSPARGQRARSQQGCGRGAGALMPPRSPRASLLSPSLGAPRRPRGLGPPTPFTARAGLPPPNASSPMDGESQDDPALAGVHGEAPPRKGLSQDLWVSCGPRQPRGGVLFAHTGVLCPRWVTLAHQHPLPRFHERGWLCVCVCCVWFCPSGRYNAGSQW